MAKKHIPHTKRPDFSKYIKLGQQELNEIEPWYLEHAEKVFEVKCKSHNEIIAIEAVMPNERARDHADGAIVIPLGQQLASYRLRGDGTMGYTCQCGASDILLDEEAILRQTRAMHPHVKAQIDRALKARGNIKTPSKLFKRIEVKK